jgi:hypothetical protein
MSASVLPAPPKGFRKEIPCHVKVDLVLRQSGLCQACGEMLGASAATQYDHVPAIQLRAYDPEAKDTVPASNDIEHLHAKHKDCHLAKTTGRKGESKLNAVHGDVAEIARLKRLTADQETFRKALLSKGEPKEEADSGKRKSRWGKRPFPSGGKREPLGKRLEEGTRSLEKDGRGRGIQVNKRQKPSLRRVSTLRAVA